MVFVKTDRNNRDCMLRITFILTTSVTNVIGYFCITLVTKVTSVPWFLCLRENARMFPVRKFTLFLILAFPAPPRTGNPDNRSIVQVAALPVQII